MNIARLANLYALGRISSSKLNKIAQQLKKSGSDSPSLKALLEQGSTYSEEQKTLFEKALKEIGQSIPSPADAANAITHDIAESIVKGEITEYEGGRKIWKEVMDLMDDGMPDQYNIFKNSASAIDDYLEDTERNGTDHEAQIQECERAILQAARELLSRHSSAA